MRTVRAATVTCAQLQSKFASLCKQDSFRNFVNVQFVFHFQFSQDSESLCNLGNFLKMSVMLLDNPCGFKLLSECDDAMLTSQTGSLLGNMS